MRNLLNVGLTAVFCVELLAGALHAQDYSADMITVSEGTVIKGKIYHTTTIVRHDMFQVDQKSGSVTETRLITDQAQKLIYVVNPQKKVILVNHVLQGLSDPTGGSSASSCAELLKAVGSLLSGRYDDCRQIGPEVVNGHSAMKWQLQTKVGRMEMPFTVWLDSTLKLPIKWEGMGSSSELKNVQLGSQSPGLFALPADYRRQDVGM